MRKIFQIFACTIFLIQGNFTQQLQYGQGGQGQQQQYSQQELQQMYAQQQQPQGQFQQQQSYAQQNNDPTANFQSQIHKLSTRDTAQGWINYYNQQDQQSNQAAPSQQMQQTPSVPSQTQPPQSNGNQVFTSPDQTPGPNKIKVGDVYYTIPELQRNNSSYNTGQRGTDFSEAQRLEYGLGGPVDSFSDNGENQDMYQKQVGRWDPSYKKLRQYQEMKQVKDFFLKQTPYGESESLTPFG